MNGTALLEVRDLCVEVGGQPVLKGVSLDVGEGEIHAIFGPNGSGKTTLLGSIMGLGKYEITCGSILFKGQDITGFSVDQRARLGIGMSFQRPPTIHGVRLRSLLELCEEDRSKIEALADDLNVSSFLDREVNAGLSGGELKRVELLQLLLQRPELVFLDEPESGVDL
ncbi:MAG: ATP-binding cassette domain-containing protein, partial [Synergistales bacterium]|nr:ATP-binding cassette domain-containing protein [Synergistales bacterium]